VNLCLGRGFNMNGVVNVANHPIMGWRGAFDRYKRKFSSMAADGPILFHVWLQYPGPFLIPLEGLFLYSSNRLTRLLRFTMALLK